MTPHTGFSDWYRARLGRWPLLIQGALWLFWGFAWIPIWYTATGATGPFSTWYKEKLGHQLPIAQVALWVLYGFIWIPLWYLKTKDGPLNEVGTMGTESPSLVSQKLQSTRIPQEGDHAGSLPARAQSTVATVRRFRKERVAFLLVAGMVSSVRHRRQ